MTVLFVWVVAIRSMFLTSTDFTATSLRGRMKKSEDGMSTKTRRSYTAVFNQEAVR